MKKNIIESDNKTYDTVGEMFDDMKKEFKNNHPFQYWIDHSLFSAKGFFGYAPHVFFIRPWIAIEFVWGHVVWAWQRVFNGYDDRVIWGIDFYLSRMMPLWLQQLKEKKHGVPGIMFEEEDHDKNGNVLDDSLEKRLKEYNAILDKIILGFKSYTELDNRCDIRSKEYKVLRKNFDQGFDLLKKYYGTLWD